VSGVNIYGPEEAGFGVGSNPAPCSDGSGVCFAGVDVPTCEFSLEILCGESNSSAQHALMLDTCGGHAMPYHYHNDLVWREPTPTTRYRASSVGPTHSPLNSLESPPTVTPTPL
jgi:hypothetical protein